MEQPSASAACEGQNIYDPGGVGLLRKGREPCGQPVVTRARLFGVVKWLCAEHVEFYKGAGALEEIEA